jgi:hypothetical protein
MCRRSVRRTVAVLVAVVALMVAGAGPASAVELGFVNELGRAWLTVAVEPEGLWERLAIWFSGTEKTLGDEPVAADSNHGSDPNGVVTPLDPLPGGVH